MERKRLPKNFSEGDLVKVINNRYSQCSWTGRVRRKGAQVSEVIWLDGELAGRCEFISNKWLERSQS